MTPRALSPAVALSVSMLALFAVNAGLLSDWVQFARSDSTASHVVLAPLVTLVLLFQQRAQIAAVAQPAWRGGVAVIAVGVALLALARVFGEDASLSVAVAGLVLASIGAFVCVYGWRATRVAAFPLAFLVFSVPPPALVVALITEILKRGSTEVVAVLFALTGTPHFRQEFVFALPTVTIEIADECSGIRSSIALLLTTLLAGHSFLDRSASRAMLLLAVLPVAILKNGIRIVTLSLLATSVDPAFLTGQLHQDGGILFFLLSLAILAPLLWRLKHVERRREATA